MEATLAARMRRAPPSCFLWRLALVLSLRIYGKLLGWGGFLPGMHSVFRGSSIAEVALGSLSA